MPVDLRSHCKYAILAMGYLAQQRRGRLVPIREIGEKVRAPQPFLAKILARLSRRGILSARRGPGGGVMLAHPADEVSLGDVVRALGGSADGGDCYLGLRRCSGSDPCPVHVTWRKVRAELDRAMAERTLDDLGQIPERWTRAVKSRR